MYRFPFKALKVDKSFVSALGHDERLTGVVEATINIGKSLSMKVVAEGVETESQLQILSNMGCELVQGYLFSKPVDAETATGYLRDDPPWTKIYESLPANMKKPA